MKTTNKRGVTVLQVMQAMCRHFGTKVGHGFRLLDMENSWVESGIEEDRLATRSDLLYDHRIFNELDKWGATIDTSGALTLEIGMFSSWQMRFSNEGLMVRVHLE